MTLKLWLFGLSYRIQLHSSSLQMTLLTIILLKKHSSLSHSYLALTNHYTLDKKNVIVHKFLLVVAMCNNLCTIRCKNQRKRSFLDICRAHNKTLTREIVNKNNRTLCL